jgi:tetratricopeptide (TPR) repeat protein
MSRAVLGGLVDRSAEWVKAVETGRLQPPRLNMLLRLARALGVTDLSELTGDDQAVPVELFTGPAQAALPAVRAALSDYGLGGNGTPPNLAHLERRLDQAWAIRHRSADHRTRLGMLLPGLIRDAQRAVRTVPDEQRRQARRLLARVYQFADFYVAYQPAPELVWRVVDRAMIEAREADDPYTIAGSAWALAQCLRETGRWDEAIAVSTDAARLLEPRLADAGPDWLAMWGALEFEVAYNLARRGRGGEAWGYWDRANDAAGRLPAGYWHQHTSFGLAVVRAHAVTLHVELRQPGEAVRRAESFAPEEITSVPRRSRHLIQVARAYHERGDRLGAFALLDKAQRTAADTVSYDRFGRQLANELARRPPTGFQDEARDLAARVGVPT